MKKLLCLAAVLLLVVPVTWAQQQGSISGTVLGQTPDGQVPLPFAMVAAFRVNQDFPTNHTMTDSAGNYVLEVPYGEYHVRAQAWPHFLPQWYDNVAHRNEATPVSVDEGNSPTGIDFLLPPAHVNEGSIAGVVVDATNDQPIGGALVVAVGSHQWNTRIAFSGDDGHYVVGSLRPDIYHIVVHKQGYFPGQYPDPIPVDGNDVTGINVALEPMVITGIAGVVIDAQTEEPISHALVIAVDVGHDRWPRFAWTNDDGHYLLRTPPGEYVVSARAQEYYPQEFPEHVLVTEEGIVEGINFALEQIDFGTISGVVIDTAGNPIPHAMVRARLIGTDFVRLAQTSQNGEYQLLEVVPGEYRVSAFHPGFHPAMYPDTVTVGPGEDVTGIDLVLVPLEHEFDGFIAGLVTDDSTGQPIANAAVFAIGFRDGPWRHHWLIRHAFTDETGAYLFENLPEIPFRLFAAARGYIGEFYDDVHTFHEATPVTPDAEGIDFALAPRTEGIRYISGQIDIAGGESPWGTVVYASANGEIVDAVPADMDGFYSFDNLMPGTYEVSAFSVYGEGEIDYPIDVVFEDVDDADILLSPTAIDDHSETLPAAPALSQNYPNPFNAQTTISFNLSSASEVSLEIFNIAGQMVTELARGQYQPGSYNLIWDGSDSQGRPVASGVYYYRLEVGERTETRKMTLLK